MSEVNMRRMHCPQCNEQISPLRAVFGIRKRPFDCSRCGTELVIPGTTGFLALPALFILWRVRVEYGYGLETAFAFVILCLVIAILQLLFTPVRRAVPL
jgi:ribosomal protein S27E